MSKFIAVTSYPLKPCTQAGKSTRLFSQKEILVSTVHWANFFTNWMFNNYYVFIVALRDEFKHKIGTELPLRQV